MSDDWFWITIRLEALIEQVIFQEVYIISGSPLVDKQMA